MRQFLAVSIDEATRLVLGALGEQLREQCPGWRWVRPANLHLTIRFLGEVGERADRAARPGWRRAAESAAPFRLGLGRLGAFPERGRPRVLWVELVELDGTVELPGLADRVESEARSAGFEPERRPFRPHLTVARAPRGGRPVLPSHPPTPETPPVDVGEMVLFESELNPSGARYTALARFALGGAGSGAS